MTGPVPIPRSTTPSIGPPSKTEADVTTRSPETVTPTQPGSLEGRAHQFRQKQTVRRGIRWELVAEIVVLVGIIIGAYAFSVAQQGLSSLNSQPPTLGPPNVVHLGSPSASAITCGGGGSATAERIPWSNSTRPVTTGEIVVRVYEIWDGDNIGDPHVGANATSTNVCAGAPPDPTPRWYLVLAAPNGTNLLTYTGPGGWASVAGGAWNITIADGSDLVLVTGASLAGTGRGLTVYGFANNSAITGSIPL